MFIQQSYRTCSSIFRHIYNTQFVFMCYIYSIYSFLGFVKGFLKK